MFVRDENPYSKIHGGASKYMCRSQYNYYGRNEQIPGMFDGSDCYINNKQNSDSFGSYYHRFDVLVLN